VNGIVVALILGIQVGFYSYNRKSVHPNPARAKAMAERGGASVSAVIAKAKLAGLWRETVKRTLENSGPVILEVHWPNVER
jgi:hypothetical protein